MKKKLDPMKPKPPRNKKQAALRKEAHEIGKVLDEIDAFRIKVRDKLLFLQNTCKHPDMFQIRVGPDLRLVCPDCGKV